MRSMHYLISLELKNEQSLKTNCLGYCSSSSFAWGVYPTLCKLAGKHGGAVGAFLFVVTLAAVIWAVLPAFSKIRSQGKRTWFRIGAMVVLFFGLLTTDYFCYWHLRPNLGLYEEPKWLAEHPGFQRKMRAKIRSNLWKSLDKQVEPTSQGSQSF